MSMSVCFTESQNLYVCQDIVCPCFRSWSSGAVSQYLVYRNISSGSHALKDSEEISCLGIASGLYAWSLYVISMLGRLLPGSLVFLDNPTNPD